MIARDGARPKRVGVVGTFVWDTIWHPAGDSRAPREQWGGILYSLAAFSAALPPGWVVEPLIKVGEDLAAAAAPLLETLPGVEAGPGLQTVPHPNPRVELRYQDLHHRTERLTGGVPGWRWSELAPLVGALDALYVNFMTGSELELQEAKRLRQGFAGPIYADLHSLFLEPPGDGARRPRGLADWQEWLGCFDVVQLNESELGLLAGEADARGFAAAIPGWGPRLVLVTLGGSGAEYVRAAGSGTEPAVRRVAVAGGEAAGDPTGCGDVWGSVLFCGLLQGLAVEPAIQRANRVAARKLRCTDTASLRAELAAAVRDGGT